MTQQELRQMVREVLKEALQQKPAGTARVETVRIASDADLAAFARRVIEMQAAVSSGQLSFTLAHGGAPSAVAATSTLPSGTPLQGVITEQVVDKHAGAGVLVLAPGAVITPLARDRARKLGLKLERRR